METRRPPCVESIHGGRGVQDMETQRFVFRVDTHFVMFTRVAQCCTTLTYRSEFTLPSRGNPFYTPYIYYFFLVPIAPDFAPIEAIQTLIVLHSAISLPSVTLIFSAPLREAQFYLGVRKG